MPDQVLRFRFQGVNYEVDPYEITGDIERELWKATKCSPIELNQALGTGAAFALAGLMWLSRRMAGERVPYKALEDSFYAQVKEAGGDVDFEILPDPVDEVGADAGPPAEGESSEE